MRSVGIIPARLAATRLPNKPLIDIGGKPMLRRVWERARLAANLSEVLIATPDEEIRRAAKEWGAVVVMTSERHRSGTDRLAEAAEKLDYDIVVNIQGDEPLIAPEAIDAVMTPLAEDRSLQMSSLMCPCPAVDMDNPACVKVVFDCADRALYFSRSRIPYPRNAGAEVWQHIGLYAYRRPFLVKYVRMDPTPLEMAESLEQLRALENGVAIKMVRWQEAPLSVDTVEDLARMRALVAEREKS